MRNGKKAETIHIDNAEWTYLWLTQGKSEKSVPVW